MVIFLLVYLLFDKKNTRSFRVYVIIGLVVSMLFFGYASWLTEPKELISAYIDRGFGDELFGKTWAVSRLTVLLLLRVILYFTPLGLLSGIIFIFRKQKDKIPLIFLLFGGLNVALFLNGAFAHPYWLYYLTPFLIFSLAQMLNKIISQKRWWWLGILLLITNTAFPVFVIGYKDQQIKKALWQNDFIDQVKPWLTEGEEIDTSWDFNEELFRYKTGQPIKILWSEEEILKNTLQKPKWHYFIFSCWANCHSQEGLEIRETLGERFQLVLREKEDRAILYDLTQPPLKHAPETITSLILEDSSKLKKPSEIILFYRKVRDFFGVNQI